MDKNYGTYGLGKPKKRPFNVDLITFLIENRPEKADENDGVICLFICFLSELWSLNCPKKCNFMQFCTNISKKSKSVKAIYIYASGISHYIFLENDVVYRSMSQLKQK